ncbi:MAG: GntR family transcriptional regulator [Thermodesulfobacteriota bacterium]
MKQNSFQVSRQAAPIRTQTLRKLREAILDGYFKPGDRLYEKELCEQFGVSRTSIREALRQLEAEGLVSTVPNQGPIVTRVSYAEAEDIYQVRELVESLAARLFAERASDDQVRDLTEAIDELEKAYLANEMREFLKVKTTVYEILFSGCGNKVAHSIFASLVARVNFLRKTSLSQPGRTRDSVAEMRAMLTAIQRRDSQGAYEKCLEHVRRASAVALALLRRQSELEEADQTMERRHGKRPA